MKRNSLFLSLAVALMAITGLGCGAVQDVITSTLTDHGQLTDLGRDEYAQGNYDQAVFHAVEALRLRPEYGKAQVLLSQALPAATGSHQRKIEDFSASADPFKWDQIHAEYEQLDTLAEAVASLPPLPRKETGEAWNVEMEDYSQRRMEARQRAAEGHYREGHRLCERSDAESQKEAAKQFKVCQSFVPDYKDAAERYRSSRNAAVKRIALMPFDDRTGNGSIYGALPESLFDHIVAAIMADKEATEFLEIVTRDQMETVMQEQRRGMSGMLDESSVAQVGKILGVSEILTGKITRVTVEPSRTVQRTVEDKRTVVVGQSPYIDKKGRTKYQDVMGEISAWVTEYKTTTRATVGGSYQVIDVATAEVKKSDAFSEIAEYGLEWATYSGEAEAMSERSRYLTHIAEEPPPVAGEMVNRALRQLGDSLAQSLKQYIL